MLCSTPARGAAIASTPSHGAPCLLRPDIDRSPSPADSESTLGHFNKAPRPEASARSEEAAAAPRVIHLSYPGVEAADTHADGWAARLPDLTLVCYDTTLKRLIECVRKY